MEIAILNFTCEGKSIPLSVRVGDDPKVLAESFVEDNNLPITFIERIKGNIEHHAAIAREMTSCSRGSSCPVDASVDKNQFAADSSQASVYDRLYRQSLKNQRAQPISPNVQKGNFARCNSSSSRSESEAGAKDYRYIYENCSSPSVYDRLYGLAVKHRRARSTSPTRGRRVGSISKCNSSSSPSSMVRERSFSVGHSHSHTHRQNQALYDRLYGYASISEALREKTRCKVLTERVENTSKSPYAGYLWDETSKMNLNGDPSRSRSTWRGRNDCYGRSVFERLHDNAETKEKHLQYLRNEMLALRARQIQESSFFNSPAGKALALSSMPYQSVNSRGGDRNQDRLYHVGIDWMRKRDVRLFEAKMTQDKKREEEEMKEITLQPFLHTPKSARPELERPYTCSYPYHEGMYGAAAAYDVSRERLAERIAGHRRNEETFVPKIDEFSRRIALRRLQEREADRQVNREDRERERYLQSDDLISTQSGMEYVEGIVNIGDRDTAAKGGVSPLPACDTHFGICHTKYCNYSPKNRACEPSISPAYNTYKDTCKDTCKNKGWGEGEGEGSSAIGGTVGDRDRDNEGRTVATVTTHVPKHGVSAFPIGESDCTVCPASHAPRMIIDSNNSRSVSHIEARERERERERERAQESVWNRRGRGHQRQDSHNTQTTMSTLSTMQSELTVDTEEPNNCFDASYLDEFMSGNSSGHDERQTLRCGEAKPSGYPSNRLSQRRSIEGQRRFSPSIETMERASNPFDDLHLLAECGLLDKGGCGQATSSSTSSSSSTVPRCTTQSTVFDRLHGATVERAEEHKRLCTVYAYSHQPDTTLTRKNQPSSVDQSRQDFFHRLHSPSPSPKSRRVCATSRCDGTTEKQREAASSSPSTHHSSFPSLHHSSSPSPHHVRRLSDQQLSAYNLIQTKQATEQRLEHLRQDLLNGQRTPSPRNENSMRYAKERRRQTLNDIFDVLCITAQHTAQYAVIGRNGITVTKQKKMDLVGLISDDIRKASSLLTHSDNANGDRSVTSSSTCSSPVASTPRSARLLGLLSSSYPTGVDSPTQQTETLSSRESRRSRCSGNPVIKSAAHTNSTMEHPVDRAASSSPCNSSSQLRLEHPDTCSAVCEKEATYLDMRLAQSDQLRPPALAKAMKSVCEMVLQSSNENTSDEHNGIIHREEFVALVMHLLDSTCSASPTPYSLPFVTLSHTLNDIDRAHRPVYHQRKSGLISSEQAELMHCTGRPMSSPSPSMVSLIGNERITRRPHGKSLEDYLIQYKHIREQRLEKSREEREEEVMRDVTFSPNIERSFAHTPGPSTTATAPITPTTPTTPALSAATSRRGLVSPTHTHCLSPPRNPWEQLEGKGEERRQGSGSGRGEGSGNGRGASNTEMNDKHDHCPHRSIIDEHSGGRSTAIIPTYVSPRTVIRHIPPEAGHSTGLLYADEYGANCSSSRSRSFPTSLSYPPTPTSLSYPPIPPNYSTRHTLYDDPRGSSPSNKSSRGRTAASADSDDCHLFVKATSCILETNERCREMTSNLSPRATPHSKTCQ